MSSHTGRRRRHGDPGSDGVGRPLPASRVDADGSDEHVALACRSPTRCGPRVRARRVSRTHARSAPVHFSKTVHNGIECGLMQAHAEGVELMEAAPLVTNVPAVIQA